MKVNSLKAIPIFCGLLFGYQLGIIGPSLPLIQEKLILTNWQSAHMVSIFIVGLIFGAISTSFVLKYFIREKALIRVCAFFIVSALIGCFVSGYHGLLTYRLLSGIATGLIATLGPMIFVENADLEKRGPLACLFQICISLGVALSYSAGVGALALKEYRFIFLMAVLPAGLALFYFMRIKNLRHPKAQSDYGLKEHKKSYLVALGLNFFQQASGISAITFFIQTLLSGAHKMPTRSDYFLPILFQLIAVMSTLLVIKKINILGRKKLLIIGALGMFVSMGIISLGHLSMINTFFILLVYVMFFATSFGPVVYLVTNEVFPDNVRAQGASLSFFLNCATIYVISLIFLPLNQRFGPSFMYSLFSLLSLAALFFVWKMVSVGLDHKNKNYKKNN
jgi:MFS family permease